MTRPFFSSCIDWPSVCDMHFGNDSILALEEMQDDPIEIDIKTFEKMVDSEHWTDLQRDLGYITGPDGVGLRIEDDPCVRFLKDPVEGTPFLEYSRIEYVFATSGEIARIYDRALEKELASTKDGEPKKCDPEL